MQFEGRLARLIVHGPLQGPAVLFVHPYPLHGACWEEQARACAEAGLRAAAVDAPGFGGTAARGAPLLMDDVARLCAAALDALGAPRAALIGCSMGGYAVMAFARLFPSRLAAAALLCTKASADSTEAKAKREQGAQIALRDGAAAAIAGLLPQLLAPATARRAPEVALRVSSLAADATAQGIADALRGMALRPDSGPSLPQWPAPTLVIAGTEDQLMPLAELQALARGIPGARLSTLAGAGHLCFLEQPREVATLIVGHLRACGFAA